MPNYYNPYNFYPVSYANQMGYSGMPQQMPIQQSFAQAPVSQSPKIMEWVEGEVGAKAYQMPNGWPANSPIPLWDSTDTVIWLKSWGPMGIPNPLQRIPYTLPDQQNKALLTAGNSGNSGANEQLDMSQYVTKQDLEKIRNEMMNALSSASNNNGNSGNYNGNSNNMGNSGNYSGNNQNGNNSGQNRGGNL